MPEQNYFSTLNTAYFLDSSDNIISLELLISAPGQTSTSVVSLDDIMITELLLKGDVLLPLKSNKQLNQVTMRITTIVTDTSRESNHTGVIVKLSGGLIEKEIPLQEEVAQEGDSVVYSIIIRFKQFIPIVNHIS